MLLAVLAGCGGSSSAPTESAAADSVATESTVEASSTPGALGATPVAPVAGAFGSTPCAPVGGAASPVREFTSPFKDCLDRAQTYTATMVTTEGTMIFTLLDEKAPGTVNNFVNLARSKYYDGIYFHRVVPEFVLQAGDPTVITEAAVTSGSAGIGGPGYTFADELPQAGEYKLGDLAMANAGPNTNGSQFFVISGPNGSRLPPNYALFGSLAGDPAGQVTLKAIAALSVTDGPPSKPVIITSLTITEG